MDPEDREHFFDFFRNDVRDVLRHFVHKIPAMSDPIFNVSVEIAEEGASNGVWQSCEAGFHAMSAVSKWAQPGHPSISHLIAMSLNDPRIQRMVSKYKAKERASRMEHCSYRHSDFY